jgi:hypothetical protein
MNSKMLALSVCIIEVHIFFGHVQNQWASDHGQDQPLTSRRGQDQRASDRGQEQWTSGSHLLASSYIPNSFRGTVLFSSKGTVDVF